MSNISTEERQRQDSDFRELITRLSKIYFAIHRDNPQFDVLRVNIRFDLERLINEYGPNPGGVV